MGWQTSRALGFILRKGTKRRGIVWLVEVRNWLHLQQHDPIRTDFYNETCSAEDRTLTLFVVWRLYFSIFQLSFTEKESSLHTARPCYNIYQRTVFGEDQERHFKSTLLTKTKMVNVMIGIRGDSVLKR